jgi:uncharacterized membrane protein YphA (DoxX/SURF4 family)
MAIVAWVLQGFCAGLYALSGAMKSTMSKERMIATGQTGVAPYPMPLLRLVALLELAGAAGLIIPWLTGTAKFLTPTAALCLIPIMVGAALSHRSLGENKQAFGVNIPLIALLAAIAWIRFSQL